MKERSSLSRIVTEKRRKTRVSKFFSWVRVLTHVTEFVISTKDSYINLLYHMYIEKKRLSENTQTCIKNLFACFRTCKFRCWIKRVHHQNWRQVRCKITCTALYLSFTKSRKVTHKPKNYTYKNFVHRAEVLIFS